MPCTVNRGVGGGGGGELKCKKVGKKIFKAEINETD